MGGGGMMGGGGPGMMGGGGPGMMGGGPGMMGPGRMLSGLDLTEDQTTQVQKIHDDLRRRNWAVRGGLMEERVKLRDLYAAPNFDQAAIAAVYKRIGELRQQMLESRLQAHAATEKVLTAEQREQLRSRWRQMGRRMGGWQGNWQGN
jgi:Spy/CpxP family protein refolding chaperone